MLRARFGENTEPVPFRNLEPQLDTAVRDHVTVTVKRWRLGNKALLRIRPMRSLPSPKAVPTIVINELRALSWGWKVILAIQCC